jgi:hypothetical protein
VEREAPSLAGALAGNSLLCFSFFRVPLFLQRDRRHPPQVGANFSSVVLGPAWWRFLFLKGAAIAGFLILISGKVLPEGLLRRQSENSFLIKPLGQLASFVMHTIEREHRGIPSQAAIG